MYTNVLKNAEMKNVQMAPNLYTRSNTVCQISRAFYMELFFQLLYLLLPFRWEKYLTTTLLMNVFFAVHLFSTNANNSVKCVLIYVPYVDIFNILISNSMEMFFKTIQKLENHDSF